MTDYQQFLLMLTPVFLLSLTVVGMIGWDVYDRHRRKTHPPKELLELRDMTEVKEDGKETRKRRSR